jgi:hypothetical protein
VTTLLSSDLDVTDSLHTVPAMRAIRAWDARGDQASAEALARDLGAGLVVSGQIARLGADSVRVSAFLRDAHDPDQPTSVRFDGTAERMSDLCDSITVAFLRALSRTRTLVAVRTTQPNLGAHSMAALREFLRGEQRYRQNDWAGAQVYYERAVTLDSTFVLALRRMRSVLRRFGEFDAQSLDYALRAGRLNHGGSRSDSLLIAADSAFAAAALTEAYSADWWRHVRRTFRLLDEAARFDRWNPEVWVQRGEASYHVGDQVGLTTDRTLDDFRRAIALDSAFAPPYFHAVELSVGQDPPEVTRALVDAYLRASPADSAMRALRLVLAGRRADADAAIAALGDYELGRFVYLLHLDPDGDDRALAAFRRLAADGRGAAYYGDTITARRWLATELLHVGRPKDAARALGDDLPNRATLAFELALAGGVAPDDMRDVVALWWRRGDTRSLLAALPWLAIARDTASLVRLGDACTPARGRECFGAFGETAPRGYLALARGDTDTALGVLSAVPDSACVRECVSERVWRATFLRAHGRPRSAASLLDRYPPALSFFSDPPLRWLVERATLADRLGAADLARALRHRVPLAWRGSTTLGTR